MPKIMFALLHNNVAKTEVEITILQLQLQVAFVNRNLKSDSWYRRTLQISMVDSVTIAVNGVE